MIQYTQVMLTPVVKATTAASSDETVATVSKKSDGTFTVTGVKAGTATITFTSGKFTLH
ncbi:Ig-like domain-containing protein [Pediococcus acidilactici]|uniref:Ig-like domain-containing protein n=1 Tax=Pediococcus acidilactici TaxID=1254 RepID=UPI001E62E96F|nr:Ig-like domain-containing protein [Pediococcus acidilactici]